jgi:hypothetical protein
LTIYADGFAVSHLIQEAFRATEVRKENLTVLFAGRFHVSKFPNGPHRVFFFIVLFRLLITVFTDLFRRHDISGWIKAIWVIALIVLFIHCHPGIFDFSGTRHGRAQCAARREARDELRRVVGFSAADEIQKLDALKKAGSVSDAEFAGLRARLVW